MEADWFIVFCIGVGAGILVSNAAEHVFYWVKGKVKT